MDGERLRQAVQRFVRALGLLGGDVTTAGQRLTVAEAHLLQLLAERQDRSTNQRELAALLGIDKSGVTRLIQRLVAARRVTRWVRPDDGRAREVALTRTGLGLAKALERSSRARFDALLSAIAARERPSVLMALDRLSEALQPPSQPLDAPPRPARTRAHPIARPRPRRRR